MRICVAKLALQADGNRYNAYSHGESAIKTNNLGNRPPSAHRFDEARRGLYRLHKLK